MPLGEDLPMLIPIAIILTMIFLFLMSVFINMSEQNEIIRMSQTSLDTIDYLSNVLFADRLGNLDYSKIDALDIYSNCKDFDNLNITTNYRIKIEVIDYTENKTWCWSSSNYQEAELSITNSVPFIIVNGTNNNLGKVFVSVAK